MGKIGTRKRGKTWQYYFQLASVDGTRKWKTGSGYRTKAEALAAGTQALAIISKTRLNTRYSLSCCILLYPINFMLIVVIVVNLLSRLFLTEFIYNLLDCIIIVTGCL